LDVVLLSTHQQNAFTRQLIGKLLSLLVRSNQYRLVTLQMTLVMLKELVFSPDSPPRLALDQLATLEQAYDTVTATLRDRLGGVLGDIFLELFDAEVRAYRQVNFEFLIKDAALLLPVSGTPMSRLDLSRRLPSGEQEKTQKAIQQFLVLRELKCTLLCRKDTLLQLKPVTLPTLPPKDPFVLETAEYPYISFMVGTGPGKKR
jgi:protein CLEC16A